MADVLLQKEIDELLEAVTGDDDIAPPTDPFYSPPINLSSSSLAGTVDTRDPRYCNQKKVSPPGTVYTVPPGWFAARCNSCGISSFKTTATRCAICGTAIYRKRFI